MKNLFNLDNFNEEDILEIIKLATEYKNGKEKKFSNKKVVNLFFEPSTRTHYSFVSAQDNLNMKVTNVNLEYSSTKKGESLYDTIKTFEAIGYDIAVVRHSQNEYYKELQNLKINILNGGDGVKNHPTQSLLDLMTIYENFKRFKGLNVAIVGDIAHSRVAHTNIEIMKNLGMNVFISGPKSFDDASAEYIDMETAIETMDVIMLLRIQFERHKEYNDIDKDEYLDKYGITMEKANKMKSKSIVMHPAPFNRNVEIADEVIECEKSVIFDQMTNGVYIRMALLDMVASHDN